MKSSTVDKAIVALEKLEKAGKRTLKEEILADHKDNEALRYLIEMGVGDQNFYIRAPEGIKSRLNEGLTSVKALRQFQKLASTLSSRKFTGKAAEKRLRECLSSVPPHFRKWFGRSFNHDLRIGVAKKTIEKVWGEMLVDTSEEGINYRGCSLARKYEDVVKPGKPIDFGERGWMSEPKLDGERDNVFVFPAEDRILIYTRTGKRRYKIEQVPEYIQRMCQIADWLNETVEYKEGTPLFLDGEFLAKNWNQTSSIVRRTKNFDPELFLREVRTLLWDWAPLSDYLKREFTMPLFRRKALLMLSAGLERPTAGFTKVLRGIYIVGHRMVHSTEEMYRDYEKRCTQGFEGTVLKDPTCSHLFKRHVGLLKLKPEDEATGTIMKCLPGKGKHAPAKKSHLKKVRRIMRQWGSVKDDDYYLHCTTDEASNLVEELQEEINDANDRRISTHVGENVVSYRYSARLGRFVVRTKKGELIRVGGKMKHAAGRDERMEYWQKREELVGMKVDYIEQSDPNMVAKARFNRFYRLREDLSKGRKQRGR